MGPSVSGNLSAVPWRDRKQVRLMLNRIGGRRVVSGKGIRTFTFLEPTKFQNGESASLPRFCCRGQFGQEQYKLRSTFYARVISLWVEAFFLSKTVLGVSCRTHLFRLSRPKGVEQSAYAER